MGETPRFINYAFKNEDGVDTFSFQDNMSDAQKYKQFGNSVTIPVIEKIANYMIKNLMIMEG